MPPPGKRQLFAADTNFLIDLEAETQSAQDALEIIRTKVHDAVIVVTPTAIDELVWGSENYEEQQRREWCHSALQNMIVKWAFQPIDFIPVGHGIIEINAAKIRAAGMIPEKEVDDSLIVVEAALLNCSLLITTDSHLLEVPLGKLHEFLRAKDLCEVLIQSPRQIVKLFGGKIRRT